MLLFSTGTVDAGDVHHYEPLHLFLLWNCKWQSYDRNNKPIQWIISETSMDTVKGCDELSAGISVHVTGFPASHSMRRMDEGSLWKMSAVKGLPLQLESHPSAKMDQKCTKKNAALLFKRILSRWICSGEDVCEQFWCCSGISKHLFISIFGSWHS